MTEDQAEEILELMRETRELAAASARDSAAHLVIAQEYKRNLGDPIERAKFAGKVIKWLVITTVTVILTLSGLAGWWDGVISKFKH